MLCTPDTMWSEGLVGVVSVAGDVDYVIVCLNTRRLYFLFPSISHSPLLVCSQELKQQFYVLLLECNELFRREY